METEVTWRKQWQDMIDGVKRKLTRKWFALEADDISSIVDLQITKAYKRAEKKKVDDFKLTPKTLIMFSERAITKEICKKPGVEKVIIIDEKTGRRRKTITNHGCASLDVSKEFDDGEGNCMVDNLPSEEPTPEEILEIEEEMERKRQILLQHMTPRTYQQLLFEYENHCVSPANQNFIAKLKEKIKNGK